MAKYLFVYHGGKAPESPEEGKEIMGQWMAWFGSMGDAVVDGGNPLGQSHTVSADGMTEDGGANPASGYTIVNADSHAAACELANGCPMVVSGNGSVEVAECLDM